MATKNAIAKAWPISPSSDGKRWSLWPAGDKPTPIAVSGLLFPENNAPGSDIRAGLTGANLLPRLSHTFIWKKFRSATAQISYEADTWHARGLDSGSFAADLDEFGAHGYPTADGACDASGQSTNVVSQGGSVHYMEMAGLGAHDYLRSPAGGAQTGYLLADGVWLVHARSCGPVSTNSRHRVYADVLGDITKVIEQSLTTTSIPALTAAFYVGASHWRKDANGVGTNDETPNGIQRGYVGFNVELSATHIAAIGALETDAQVLAYCAANGLTSNLWFLNMNPRPTDITDKSGNNRHMTWANVQRPTLWTGLV